MCRTGITSVINILLVDINMHNCINIEDIKLLKLVPVSALLKERM